jgi:hypothetical protein
MTKILDEDFVQLNPDERKRLKEMVEEACGFKRIIKDKQGIVRDIITNAHDTFGVPKKVMTSVINMHHMDNYIEASTENEHGCLYYETLFDGEDD